MRERKRESLRPCVFALFPVFLFFFSDLKMKKTIFSLFLTRCFFFLFSLSRPKKKRFFPSRSKKHTAAGARKNAAAPILSAFLSILSVFLSILSLRKEEAILVNWGGGGMQFLFIFRFFSLKSLFLFPFAPLVSSLSPSLSLLLPNPSPSPPSRVPQRSNSAHFFFFKRRNSATRSAVDSAPPRGQSPCAVASAAAILSTRSPAVLHHGHDGLAPDEQPPGRGVAHGRHQHVFADGGGALARASRARPSRGARRGAG